MEVLPELCLSPLQAFNTASVELRYGQRHLVGDILVEDTHKTHGDGGEDKVEKQNVAVVEEICDVEVAVDLEPEDAERPDHVLVEEIANALCQASVGPTTVNEDQPLEEAELRNGIVR